MTLEQYTFDELVKVALARPEGDELRVLAEKAEVEIAKAIADSREEAFEQGYEAAMDEVEQ